MRGKMSEEKKTNALDVLFPEKKVPLSETLYVTVRPLSLKEMPKVSVAFNKIMQYVAEGRSFAEVGSMALTELMELLPFCVDLPPQNIPQWAIPDIIDIVLEQNATESIVGKWQALITKLQGKFEVEVTGQGKEEADKA